MIEEFASVKRQTLKTSRQLLVVHWIRCQNGIAYDYAFYFAYSIPWVHILFAHRRPSDLGNRQQPYQVSGFSGERKNVSHSSSHPTLPWYSLMHRKQTESSCHQTQARRIKLHAISGGGGPNHMVRRISVSLTAIIAFSHSPLIAREGHPFTTLEGMRQDKSRSHHSSGIISSLLSPTSNQ